jgi:hypothetical protein
MMNARNTLHPALKLDTGRVRAGNGFQVFCGAGLANICDVYGQFSCVPLPVVVRMPYSPVALHLDIFLLAAPAPHHAPHAAGSSPRQQRI